MLKTILFPKFCLGCGFMGVYVCLGCRQKLMVPAKDSCVYCGKGSYCGLTHFNCKRNHGLDGVLSIFQYSDVLRKVIKGIKYKFIKEAFSDLFLSISPEILSEKLRFYKTLDKKNLLLQPIPLHPLKAKSRGFNQAEIIGLFFNSFIGANVVSIVAKEKETKPQAMLTKEMRLKNIANSFELKKGVDVKGKTMLLVDDVITTGNTIKTITKVIKNNGAHEVYALSLARG